VRIEPGIAGKEARARGRESVRPEYQRYLPRFGEEFVMNATVGFGKKDRAAGMRVIPANDAAA
jgi:hypothetical protein